MKKKILIGLVGVIGNVLLMASVWAHTVGESSPSCTLTSLDGKAIHNLQELRGEVVYVDFWASWCPPCVRSFPFMDQLDHDFKDQGLRVIGINMDEKLADAESFLDQYPVDFDIAVDADKQCVKDFGVMAMPTSYLIDRNGVIRHIHQGFRAGESEKLRLAIKYLLNEPQ
ncbi:MAG: TlpA family protein disulfide reductase [Nitrosomonas sp.]|nr:TlpA family protein disulfide reductase [Nitrosomonas sp.]